MNYIQLFKSKNIPITWTSLLLGIEGPGKFEGLVDSEEIKNYAIEFMDLNDEFPNEVFELASAYKDEKELVYKLVKELSSRELIEKDSELKKWIVILLVEKLKNMPEKPLYGLISLTEFWRKFDYPVYSPHVVQGRGNDIQPEKYYSEEFYRACLLEHKKGITETKMNF